MIQLKNILYFSAILASMLSCQLNSMNHSMNCVKYDAEKQTLNIVNAC